MNECSIEGCHSPEKSRGWCSRHYSRVLRHGDPTIVRDSNATPEERLQRRGWDVTEAGCWEVRGTPTNKGYGYVWNGTTNVGAHRMAYEVWVGPIPEGLYVCHSCDNRVCINPDHLWVGTHDENMADMVAKGRKKRTI